VSRPHRRIARDSKPHVVLTIPAIAPGGAERVICSLANDFARRGWPITVATLEKAGTEPFYPLDPEVALVQLSALSTRNTLDRLWSIPVRVFSIRAFLKRIRPDVVVSFMDTMNIAAIAASQGLDIPVIVSERVDPIRNRHRLGRLKSALRTLSYHLADTVVVQTESIRAGFRPSLQRQMLVIPNAITPAPCKAMPGSPGPDGRFRLVGVGRLDAQKGFDRALAAFAELAHRFPDWDLWIWGEGTERVQLEKMIQSLGLSDRVRLPGVTRAIAAELCCSHVLVISSRYEGFPNALGEAMAAGLPAVGFAGVSGVEELIEDRRSGLVIPEGKGTAGLVHALAVLMGDADERARMGRQAIERSRMWPPERIWRLWAGAVERAYGSST
jgi:GalNAc-alpha-(1->4)-GalNAc-alpha-(1->3)-diNAcBac-PP-undecaprenol alpha-1,4-N-acetyl-D-galactosaminyltransferase